LLISNVQYYTQDNIDNNDNNDNNDNDNNNNDNQLNLNGYKDMKHGHHAAEFLHEVSPHR